jgi:elongation factor G
MIQMPIGLEDKLEGVVDLIEMVAFKFYGDNGETIERGPIPADLAEQAETMRQEMLDNLSLVSDELTEAILEEKVTPEILRKCLRDATIALKCTPVMCGSALGNKGVQLLLDGVCSYLPEPRDVENVALDLDKGEEPVVLESNPDKPLVMLAFKLEDGRYGQLTYIRVYSGHVHTGQAVYNSAKGRRERVGRLLRMHANKREEIEEVFAGDIAAVVGMKNVTTGDTLSDADHPVILEKMEFPTPVMHIAVEPKSTADQEKMIVALQRLAVEDPSFRMRTDEETGQTVISGMGELHLDIIVDRMRREYKVDANVGKPQVAYRETITKEVESEGKYIRQSGGRGQYGHVWLKVRPAAQGAGFRFISSIQGGSIPREYVPAVGKGVEEAVQGGVLAGYPMVDVEVELFDGSYHEVDSNEMAFKIAGSIGFKEGAQRAGPILLEPIMATEVVMPEAFMGNVIGDLSARRGKILHMEPRAGMQVVSAHVPLAEMFGYSTSLRSATEGRAIYTMQFHHYAPVPGHIAETLVRR